MSNYTAICSIYTKGCHPVSEICMMLLELLLIKVIALLKWEVCSHPVRTIGGAQYADMTSPWWLGGRPSKLQLGSKSGNHQNSHDVTNIHSLRPNRLFCHPSIFTTTTTRRAWRPSISVATILLRRGIQLRKQSFLPPPLPLHWMGVLQPGIYHYRAT